MQLATHSWHWQQSFDQSFDGAFQLGNKTPNLTWSGSLPNLTRLPLNVPVSANIRSVLSGDGSAAANAVLTVIYVSGTASAGWADPGAGGNLTNTGTVAGSGVFFVRATYFGLTIDSPPIAWSIVASTHSFKWDGNTGWWMGSNAIVVNGRPWTDQHFTPEIAALKASPAVVTGYRIFMTWSHWNPNNANGVLANYHSADIDGFLAAIAPRKLAVQFNWGVFNASVPTRPSATDFSTIPKFILTNPGAYGAGAPSGDPNGLGGYFEQGSGYGANICNAAVFNAMVQDIQAFAAKYDGHPQVAFFGLCEDSNTQPNSNTGLIPAFVTAYRALYTAARNAFTQTPVYAQGAFIQNAQASLNQCIDMVAKGVLQGGTDTYGGSFVGTGTNPPYTGLNWGEAAYTGTAMTGTTGTLDRRALTAAIIDMQGANPDFNRSTSVADLAAGCNKCYQASVVFFCWAQGLTGTQAWANWATAVTQFAANPLLKTGYPANLP